MDIAIPIQSQWHVLMPLMHDYCALRLNLDYRQNFVCFDYEHACVARTLC